MKIPLRLGEVASWPPEQAPSTYTGVGPRLMEKALFVSARCESGALTIVLRADGKTVDAVAFLHDPALGEKCCEVLNRFAGEPVDRLHHVVIDYRELP